MLSTVGSRRVSAAAVVFALIGLAPAVAHAAPSLHPASGSPRSLGAPSTTGNRVVLLAARTSSATVVVVSSTSTTLRRGDFGKAVRALQLKLRARGQHYVVADGSFGSMTQRAVKVVQRVLHLKATGVADVVFLRKIGLRVVVVAMAPRSAASQAPRSPAATKYLRAFPIVGTPTQSYSTTTYPYSDVFGKPGAEGQIQGADLPAAKDTPVVAVCNATVININRVATGLGGIWIWLQDVTGNQYYYAHLSTISAALNVGSQVRTGQEIGAVGNTGDAAVGAPYLYLEVHPGGAVAIDPFSDLNILDPAGTAL